LLALLATLDRGLAASSDDVTKVENFALQLESASEPVILGISTTSGDNGSHSKGRKSGLELLNGRWRLAYSSGFSGGNLGGRRPGPPAALLPLTLGAVYQDIFVSAKELDNVVTLTSKLSLASWFNVDPPAVTARLKHSFSIEGAATVRIVFEKTIAKTSGGIGGWLDSLPQFATPMLPESLRPVTAPARDATFDVTFLDERMRITRGDRGELRVFVKES
jgi:PAP_fibrillin